MERRLGSLFQDARDVPNGFSNENAVTNILVHRESLGAPDADKILRKMCTPTVALLSLGERKTGNAQK